MKNHILHFLYLCLMLAYSHQNCFAQNANDLKKSVPLWFEYNASNQSAVLKWMNDPLATSYNVGVVNYLSTPTFQFVQTVPGGVDSFVIPDFKIGQLYHYRVSKSTGGAGFIDFGIELPLIEFRGRCLLVIDDRFAGELDDQLIQWEADIEGDGWIVDTIHIKTGWTPPQVKIKIREWYLSGSRNKTVVLFGAVPVPYSGNTAIDGHPDHSGAWSSDTYYADMDGSWTDSSVNSTTASRPENQNIPGDGKFDPIVIPSDLELEIGRIDFSKLPAFTQTESELLKAYLKKNHLWRTGQNPYPQRALMENNFPTFDEGFGQNAWRNFVPMFGEDNVIVGDYENVLVNEKYLYTYACGGGSYTSCGGIGTTQNLWAVKSIQSIFTMTFGSYFGDYDSQNNFLRGALASGDILTNMWAGRPNWILSSMATGAHIGQCTKLTQNGNGGFFFSGNGPRFTHIALMGDPTLRLHPLPMVKNLTAALKDRKIILEWEKGDSTQQDFAVFEVSDAYQSFVDMVYNQTSYEISCPKPGTNKRFLVKPVALTETASGSYFNTGTGSSVAVFVDPATFPVASFTYDSEFESVQFQNMSVNTSHQEWSFGDGAFSVENSPVHVFSQPGSYQTCLYVHNNDDCIGAELCQEVIVASSLPEKVESEIKHVTCYGGHDGSIQVKTTGGNQDMVAYYWKTGQTGKEINNLTSGVYVLVIKSLLSGDSLLIEHEVLQPDSIKIMVTITHSTGNDGVIELDVDGGTPPYSYGISSSGGTLPGFSQLAPGTYAITVTDFLGCSKEIEVVVDLINAIHEIHPDHVIFPNPARDKVVVSIDKPASRITIRNGLDQVMASNPETIKKEWQVDITPWPSGVYWVEIMFDTRSMIMIPLVKISE